MKCPACSTDVPLESLFCPKCGGALKGQAAPESPAESGLERLQQTVAAAKAGGNETEHDLWKGGFSPKAMLGYWLLAGVVTLVGIVIGIFLPSPLTWALVAGISLSLWAGMALYLLYQRMGVEYQLTTQRLFHRSGILTRVTNRVEVIDIDDVQFTQSFIERFLGVGTIRILSTDVSDPKLILSGIDDVKNVADTIDKVRREERRRRGIHIETV